MRERPARVGDGVRDGLNEMSDRASSEDSDRHERSQAEFHEEWRRSGSVDLPV